MANDEFLNKTGLSYFKSKLDTKINSVDTKATNIGNTVSSLSTTVSSLQQTKANSSDVYSKSEADSKFTVTVDTALSSTSTNPVQNKVVNTKIISIESDTACNLIDTSTIANASGVGITRTNNNDGSISYSGTATAVTFQGLGKQNLTAGTYTFSGHPTKSTSKRYAYQIYKDNALWKTVSSDMYTGTNSFKFSVTAAGLYAVGVYLAKDEAIDEKFYSHLEKGSTAHAYLRYTGDNGSLNKDVADIILNKVDANDTACNLIDTSTVSTNTTNGLTQTVNSDGSITCSGTTTASTRVAFCGNNLTLEKGTTYALSLGLPSGTTFPSGTSGSLYKDGTWLKTITIKASGTTTITVSDTASTYSLGIGVPSGATFNYTIKPMLEKGTTAHNYVKFTGSTGTLNSDVAELQKKTKATEWKDILSSSTDKASGSYVKCKKSGDVVNIVGNITYTSNASHGTYDSITIPTNIASDISPAFAPTIFGVTATNQMGIYARIQKQSDGSLKLQIYTQDRSNMNSALGFMAETPPNIGKGRNYMFSMTYLV